MDPQSIDPQEVVSRWPYPIAAIYADLLDPAAPLPRQREALYFTVYQLLRTLGLPLLGQYFSQDLPASATPDARRKLNEAIARLRAPHFSDWIGLMGALRTHGPELGLDFLPEFARALERAKRQQVVVPAEYADGTGNRTLNLLDAFQWLRNGCNHSGRSGEESCRAAVAIYRPWLDELLACFDFLPRYELLALRSALPAEAGVAAIQSLCGAQLAPAQPVPVDAALRVAFEVAPVVMRTPDGRAQALFPFFHAHIEGEPLHAYDGHYLRNDPKMPRRTVYYLGTERRLPLDDSDTAQMLSDAPPNAGKSLLAMLESRQVPWKLETKSVAPWTIRDCVNDYARRTLHDQIGNKYLPACYLDRPALSAPLEEFVTADTTPYRALLLVGAAGCGKTALLCDTVRRLLADQEEHLVFFLRGDGIVETLPGDNLLLANLLHKIGLDPDDFPTFGALFAHLAQRRPDDQIANRRFVVILDAVNEAPAAPQVLAETLELVSAARSYEWVRIVFSARTEFLAVWQGRRTGLEANPFHPVQSLFLPPPVDPANPPRPEDPPAWRVPIFTQEEAQKVYGRYQTAKAGGKAMRACLTPWPQIAPATRAEILTVPLHLDLWMSAFDGRNAPAIADTASLFDAYLADIGRRFGGDVFWRSLREIVDRMLAQGRMELNDNDANDIQAAWEAPLTDRQLRLRYSPLEIVCAAGVMQKRVAEEGGGYRIPFQRLREALVTWRLKERDPQLSVESLRAWLTLAPTPELEGALAQIGEQLWRADRSGDLAVYVEEGAEGEIGSNALARTLALRLALREEGQLLATRLRALLARTPEDDWAGLRLAELLLFAVTEQVAGFSLTETMVSYWSTLRDWLITHQKSTDAHDPVAALWARDLSVSYERLGNLAVSAGNTQAAQRYYDDYSKIAQRLYEADPSNAGFARDLSVSYERLGDLAVSAGNTQAAQRYFEDACAIRQRLYEADPSNAGFARDLSVSYNKLGDLAVSAGNTQAAQRYFEDGLKIAQRLYEADPSNAGFARDLSVSYERLGNLAVSAGNTQAAQRYFEDACAIRQRLYEADPGNAVFARELCVPYARLGSLAGGTGTEEGRTWLKRARDLLRTLQAERRMPDVQVAGYLAWLEQNLTD